MRVVLCDLDGKWKRCEWLIGWEIEEQVRKRENVLSVGKWEWSKWKVNRTKLVKRKWEKSDGNLESGCGFQLLSNLAKTTNLEGNLWQFQCYAWSNAMHHFKPNLHLSSLNMYFRSLLCLSWIISSTIILIYLNHN